jgi:hypothetical protein
MEFPHGCRVAAECRVAAAAPTTENRFNTLQTISVGNNFYLTFRVREIFHVFYILVKRTNGVIPRKMMEFRIPSLCFKLQKVNALACAHAVTRFLTGFLFWIIHLRSKLLELQKISLSRFE